MFLYFYNEVGYDDGITSYSKKEEKWNETLKFASEFKAPVYIDEISAIDDSQKLSSIFFTIEDIRWRAWEISQDKKNLYHELEKYEKKVDSIRHDVTFFAALTALGIVGFFTLIGFAIGVIFGAIIGFIIGFALANGITNLDERIHKKKNEQRAEEFIIQKLEPLKEEIKDFENLEQQMSDCISWAKYIISPEYFNEEDLGDKSIRDIQKLFDTKRASTLKEALNLYETIRHQQRMEELQTDIRDSSLQTAGEVTKQSEYARKVARNTAVTAVSSTVTAYNTHKTAKNTKKINRKL